MFMQDRTVRALGLLSATLYAIFIVWLYVRQPQSIAEVTGGLSATVGAYRIDQQAFDDGLAMFRQGQYDASRAAFERADPAQQDARTQFYIAYSYYRSGWGRFYNEDEDFKLGLDRIEKAITLAPNRRLIVEDPENGIRNADELRAELAAGLRTDASDLNPMRVFRKRK
jgi:tetratricopeptide (TPR) repeat protein